MIFCSASVHNAYSPRYTSFRRVCMLLKQFHFSHLSAVLCEAVDSLASWLDGLVGVQVLFIFTWVRSWIITIQYNFCYYFVYSQVHENNLFQLRSLRRSFDIVARYLTKKKKKKDAWEMPSSTWCTWCSGSIWSGFLRTACLQHSALFPRSSVYPELLPCGHFESQIRAAFA